MTAEELFALLFELAPNVDPDAALALGEVQWPAMASRTPCPHDAESCRLLSLAALELNPPDFLAADLWRTRALTRFALSGWHEGMAAVLMGRALTALSKANEDYPNGKTLDVIQGCRPALAFLDELEYFIRASPSGISVGPRSPDQALLARFLHEKRGFLLLALGDLDAAKQSYKEASAAAVGNPRGSVKVRLGHALVDYVSGARSEALADTRAALADAKQLGPAGIDLVEWGEANVTVMERNGVELRPYEIL